MIHHLDLALPGESERFEDGQEIAHQAGGEIGGVRVPEQDIESGRVLAEQVIVDDVVPDQVVWPQPDEAARQIVALDDARLVRAAARQCEAVIADKRARLDIVLLGMQHAHHQRQRAEQALAALGIRRQLARQHRCRLPARTSGGDVDLVALRDRGDRLHRLAAGIDVIGHVPMALILAGVLPADHEGLNTVIDLIFDYRFFGAEVVDIHLVDLGRDGQLGDRVDLVRGRGIMDQLHHLGAQDDRTFRRRDIFAQFEGLLIDLADHALVVDEVVIGVLQALDQAEAAAGDRHLLRAGIADQRVGG